MGASCVIAFFCDRGNTGVYDLFILGHDILTDSDTKALLALVASIEHSLRIIADAIKAAAYEASEE